MGAAVMTSEAKSEGAGVPSPERCVIGSMLDHWARETPDAIFALFDDGNSWTFRETQRRVHAAAAGLRGLGVGQGDLVLTWLPNGPAALVAWFATTVLGAVYVPLNTAYRGQILAHVLTDTGARVMIAHAALVPRLRDVTRGPLADVVVIGDDVAPVEGLRLHGGDVLAAQPEAFTPPQRPVAPWDTHAIIYTSGTTGPSKGVMTSYVQTYSSLADVFTFLDARDRFLANLPLFHVGGMGMVYMPLMKGASVAFVEAFEARAFWSVIRRTGATMATLLGAMATFLVKQPPSVERAAQ